MISKFTSVTLLGLVGACTALAQGQLNKLTDCETADGFSLLFDGTRESFAKSFVNYSKNNTTNTNLGSQWSVNAATSSINLTANGTDVRSTKTYKDFDLRIDYRNPGNEGIFYRSKVTTDVAWQTGIEYAINNFTELTKDAPGAAYDLYAPSANVYQPFASGIWNRARIVAIGDSVEHWLNGTKVVGFKLHSPSFWIAYNASKWNTNPATMTYAVAGDKSAGYIKEGYLGLQADHQGLWQMRNLRVNDTKPYHGPERTTNCSSAAKDVPSARSTGSSLRRTGTGLDLEFRDLKVKSVRLVSVEGKAYEGGMAEGGNRAVFEGAFKPGVYVAKVTTYSGAMVWKLNLL